LNVLPFALQKKDKPIDGKASNRLRYTLSVMCVDSLLFVDATILELSRYRTLVPFALPHRTMRDTEVGGYFIPGGTTVLPYAAY